MKRLGRRIGRLAAVGLALVLIAGVATQDAMAQRNGSRSAPQKDEDEQVDRPRGRTGRTSGDARERSTRGRSAERDDRSEADSREPDRRQRGERAADRPSDGTRRGTEARRSRGSDHAPQHSLPPPARRPQEPARHHQPKRPPSHTYPRANPPSHVVVRVEWPWQHRHRSGWSPRYRFRQRVLLEVDRGYRRRVVELDVRTIYRHRVRSASPRHARVDVEIERLELFAEGRFIGEVNHVPRHLRYVRATIDRRGRIDFDRDLFIVGTPRDGFELIATRHYDRYVLDAYERGHDVDVGVLDFRQRRVVPVRRSRLFDPYGWDVVHAPIPLLPDEPGRLLDYGPAHARSYPDYRYDTPTSRRPPDRVRPRSSDGDIDVRFRDGESPADGWDEEIRHRTRDGVDVRLQRESEIERVD